MSNVHVTASMMADGGGGGKHNSTIPSIHDSAEGERLDIADVLGGTVELSENIMYATLINPAEINKNIQRIQNHFTANSCGATITEYVDTMEAYLANTNSQQFYTGDVATKNRENMEMVKANVAIINGAINKLDPAEIISIANQYNEKLAGLKEHTRRNLLEEEAKKYNRGDYSGGKRPEWPGYPIDKYYTYKLVEKEGWGIFNDQSYWHNGLSSPYEDSSVDKCNVSDSQTEEFYVENHGKYSSNVSETTDSDGKKIKTTTTKYKFTVHKYKKITCNYGAERLVMWWDPSFEEIEAQFDKVGWPVPYNRENVQLKAHEDASFLGISWNANFKG